MKQTCCKWFPRGIGADIFTQGNTLDEFMENIKEAVEVHFAEALQRNEKISEENKEVRKCCVCSHPLDYHIDEDDGWRCHLLGNDGYQCECFLRKGRAEGDISYYDDDKRREAFLKEEGLVK